MFAAPLAVSETIRLATSALPHAAQDLTAAPAPRGARVTAAEALRRLADRLAAQPGAVLAR